MSYDGATTIRWPDDERRFRLGIGELIELQDKCNAGPEQIFHACADKTWRVEWVKETIRLGLIGGGLEPMRALALVSRYVTPGGLMTCKEVAIKVLYAALVGDPDDVLGKPEAEVASLDGGTSRPSTDAGPSSDTPPAKSGNAHSLNL